MLGVGRAPAVPEKTYLSARLKTGNRPFRHRRNYFRTLLLESRHSGGVVCESFLNEFECGHGV